MGEFEGFECQLQLEPDYDFKDLCESCSDCAMRHIPPLASVLVVSPGIPQHMYHKLLATQHDCIAHGHGWPMTYGMVWHNTYYPAHIISISQPTEN